MSKEQKRKLEKPNNPYEALPRIVLLTYQLPHTIINIASGGEFDTFDLNIFFLLKVKGKMQSLFMKMMSRNGST